jgi:hypothetical protein
MKMLPQAERRRDASSAAAGPVSTPVGWLNIRVSLEGCASSAALGSNEQKRIFLNGVNRASGT